MGNGVSNLIVAFALFVALHSIPAMPTMKGRIIRRIGRLTYLVVYSIASTAVLVWLFYEAINRDYVELWEPAAWQARITLVAAPIGLFLVISGLLSSNPLSVTLRNETDTVGAVVYITRHPVLWGFFIWSTGHVFPNGDLRSLVLFGGFAVFSLAGILMAERRSRRRLGGLWELRTKNTSVIPFLSLFVDRRMPTLDLPMVIGAACSIAIAVLLLYGGHAALFSVDPLETLRVL
jgi:uncharacterized membrane protein